MIVQQSIFDADLPLMLTPQEDKSSARLTEWVKNNLSYLQEILNKHGALLFRGFDFKSPSEFERLTMAFCPHLKHYAGGNSPRSKITGKVYSSTEIPHERKLSLHNEASYLPKMPDYIFFYCDVPPAERGQTPLADCRKLYKGIDPEIVNRFADRELCYINNLHGGFGFGKSWQETFETENKQEVEQHLKEQGYSYSWQPDGGLRTITRCPAVATHPVTGEKVWINQAEQWHPSVLDEMTRESLLAMFKAEELPHYVHFGDGAAIPESDLTHIREVMDSEEKLFDWEKGDVLVCDNLLVAHGREPFSGDRRILVTIGQVEHSVNPRITLVLLMFGELDIGWRNPESVSRNAESPLRSPEIGLRGPESGLRNAESPSSNANLGQRNPDSLSRSPYFALRNPESPLRHPKFGPLNAKSPLRSPELGSRNAESPLSNR